MTDFGLPTRLSIDPWGTTDRGYATMRVTSPYGPRSDGFHAALDIGNARLGDDIIAAGDGTVILASTQPLPPWNYPAPASKIAVWGPSYGGLTTVIDHGRGWFSQYAHQRDTLVRAGQRVTRGQLIGHVGDSGSAAPPPAGGGGHLHFGMRYLGATGNGHNGWVDPWPLIHGQAHPHLTPDTAMELSMSFTSAADFDHVVNRRTKLTVGANFRAAPTRASDSHQVFPAGTTVIPVARVGAGEDIGGNATWFGAWNWVEGRGWTFGFYHASVLGELERFEATDCGPEIQKATLKLTNRLERKNTAIEASLQAMTAARDI